MPNSAWCELEGLKRSKTFLVDVNGLQIDTIVTDRNRQVAKWIREEIVTEGGKHFYDVWHCAKSKSTKQTGLLLHP